MNETEIVRRRTNIDDGWAWCLASGELHRVDGPAVERDDGTLEWYRDGELHREDGPAIITPARSDFGSGSGWEEWFLNGLCHRLDGPAFTTNDGTTEAWYVNDQRHREDGPAEIKDGTSSWWQYDQLHRLDGPAREYHDGRHEWFVRGLRIPDDQTTVLEELHTSGAREQLTHVLSTWRPDGPTTVELAAAVRAATG